MTSQKLSEEHEILRRFMAVVVSSAFWDSLIIYYLLNCGRLFWRCELYERIRGDIFIVVFERILHPQNQEPLTGPFLNELFSSSRKKRPIKVFTETAH